MSIAAYLDAAKSFVSAAATIKTPPLTTDSLNQITQLAQTTHHSDPQFCWALLSVAAIAAEQQPDEQLIGEANWWRAWVCNIFFRPDLAQPSIERAQKAFLQTEQPGWLAACTWQEYALPWVSSDWNQTKSELEALLPTLRKWDPLWARQCGLTLTHTNILLGNTTEAREILHRLAQFSALSEIDHGYIHLFQSLIERKDANYEKAIDEAKSSLALFQANKAMVASARANESIATTYLRAESYSTSRSPFEEALHIYELTSLNMRSAVCHNGLAQLAIRSGQFDSANNHFHHARRLLSQIDVPVMLADICFDESTLALQQGDTNRSLSLIRQSISIYGSTGSVEQSSLSKIFLAAIYQSRGLIQKSLIHLEQRLVDNPSERASGHIYHYLAIIWQQLGDTQKARDYCYRALRQFDELNLPLSKCNAQINYANLFIQDHDTASTLLLNAEQTGRKLDFQQNLPLIQLARGKLSLAKGKYLEAIDQFEAVLADLHQAGRMEGMLNLIACYVLVNNRNQAGKMALALFDASDRFPEYQFHACALLAEFSSNSAETLSWLETGLNILLQIRRGFTQADLSGGYLAGLRESIDKIVHTSIAYPENGELLLRIIEESKASTTLHHLASTDYAALTRPEQQLLNTKRAAIHSHIFNLNQSGETIDAAKTITLLKAAEVDFSETISRLKRHAPELIISDLQLNWLDCVERLNSRYSKNWIVLDFYMLDEIIVCLAGRPDGTLETNTLSIHQYDLLVATDSSMQIGQRQLEKLAPLIPHSVRSQLNPETILFIAPHRSLHQLPWPAIVIDNQPLVMHCTPCIVPSLQALEVLIERDDGISSRNGGLVLTVEEFELDYEPLPGVMLEATWINEHLDVTDISRVHRWKELAEIKELFHSAEFLHIATHAFFDPNTGLNSGFALKSEDVWVDQLLDIGPIPPLVFFSACSCGQKLVLDGDELIGTAIASLSAGANTVISSLRPIVDDTASTLVIDFYQAGDFLKHPAHALARAQRGASTLSGFDSAWVHFSCFGLP